MVLVKMLNTRYQSSVQGSSDNLKLSLQDSMYRASPAGNAVAVEAAGAFWCLGCWGEYKGLGWLSRSLLLVFSFLYTVRNFFSRE